MRADRLLSIMLLLQTHRRMTAQDLAGRLEVSERTIHRDMDSLSAAGVPVVAERGIGGGWSLIGEYQTNLTGLNEAEIQALFLSRSPRLLDDLGLGKAAEAAFIKLFATVPPAMRRDAESASQRIYVDGAGWNRNEETVPFLPLLQEAVWKNRAVRFKYQRGDDCEVERVAGPLGLVAKGGAWYLVAAIDGDIRNYRISRVIEAEITDQPFVRPEAFDLVAHWRQSAVEFKSKFPRYTVTARVHPEAVNKMYIIGRFSRVEDVAPPDEADEKGWRRVSICFQFEDDACECLLGFGDQIEVLEPSELRRKLVDRARCVVEFYNLCERDLSALADR
ncbi:MAG: YafY family transcriptional regulator [Chloracidobacterium sp.]|nr:YafY family transcriptional regulator [Chloracidobacterium sp.]